VLSAHRREVICIELEYGAKPRGAGNVIRPAAAAGW